MSDNPRGHVWKLDAKGNPEFFGDDHDGPWCARCDALECRHCYPGFLTEDCPEYGTELPGLELTNSTAEGKTNA